MIDTVISDLGQVLLHFNNRIFFQKMMQYTRRSVEEIREAAHDNLELLYLFELGKIMPEEFYDRIKTALGANVNYEQFYADYSDIFALNGPILKVIAKLKPKYKLAMISNTDIMRFTFIKNRFPEILIFDGYALSFDLGLRKPDPEIYRAALRAVGSPPESAIFIDDIQENVESAERLGIKGILFTTGTDLEAELGKFGVKA